MTKPIPDWVRERDPEKRRSLKQDDYARRNGVRKDGNAYVGKSGARHEFHDDASRQLASIMARQDLPPLSKYLAAFLQDGKLGIRSKTREWRFNFLDEAPLKVLVEWMTEAELASERNVATDAQHTTTTNNENPNDRP